MRDEQNQTEPNHFTTSVFIYAQNSASANERYCFAQNDAVRLVPVFPRITIPNDNPETQKPSTNNKTIDQRPRNLKSINP